MLQELPRYALGSNILIRIVSKNVINYYKELLKGISKKKKLRLLAKELVNTQLDFNELIDIVREIDRKLIEKGPDNFALNLIENAFKYSRKMGAFYEEDPIYCSGIILNKVDQYDHNVAQRIKQKLSLNLHRTILNMILGIHSREIRNLFDYASVIIDFNRYWGIEHNVLLSIPEKIYYLLKNEHVSKKCRERLAKEEYRERIHRILKYFIKDKDVDEVLKVYDQLTV